MKINRLLQVVGVSGVLCMAVPAVASSSALPVPSCGGDADDDDKDEKDSEETRRLCGGDADDDDKDEKDSEETRQL